MFDILYITTILLVVDIFDDFLQIFVQLQPASRIPACALPRLLGPLLTAAALFALAAPAQAETATLLDRAAQFGISYLPMIVAKQQKLIEHERRRPRAGLPAPEIEPGSRSAAAPR